MNRLKCYEIFECEEFRINFFYDSYTINIPPSRKCKLNFLLISIDQEEVEKVIYNQNNYNIIDYEHHYAICKQIIEICPQIINLKTIDGDTALDLIMIKEHVDIPYLYFFKEKLAKILLAKGADLPISYPSWFGDMKIATEKIDQIMLSSINKKIENPYQLRINEDLYDMLAQRCCFKYMNILNNFKKADLYEIYKIFIFNIRTHLDEIFCKKLEIMLNPPEFNGIKLTEYESIEKFILAEYEVQLKGIFKGYDILNCISYEVISNALKHNFKFSETTLAAHKKIISKPKYQEEGSYLNKILDNQPKLIEKLKTKPEGLKILFDIQKEVLLPLEVAIKLNKFLDKVEFEKEDLTKNIQDLLKEEISLNKLALSPEEPLITQPEKIEECVTLGQQNNFNEANI